jgi:energy-coupling factor transporter ATP-binding protein EcfA2
MQHKVLSDFVKTADTFARSINIERDLLDDSVRAGYHPTSRAREAAWRIVEAMTASRANRAWTLVGPYGSGKSAFALWLTGLLAPQSEMRGERTAAVVKRVDPALAKAIETARTAAGAVDGGVILAVATAQRESVAKTVARALLSGVERGASDLLSSRQKSALRRADDAGEIRDAFRAVTRVRPVLLLIDEFGKNLEYAAASPDVGDLFLLQQLAEDFSGESSKRSLLLTLQHMSTGDYMSGLSTARRQEWAKVQGRFEEIPFLESDDQTLDLVRSVFDVRKPPRGFESQLEEWESRCITEVDALGLGKRMGIDRSLIHDTYPLHPLLLAVLPELVSRHGQNERTLFDFLAGPQSGAVPAFMNAAQLDGSVPVVGLAHAYDFFCGSEDSGGAARSNPRWHEVRAIVRDAAMSASRREIDVLKAAALLNLVSSGGVLRASTAALMFAAAPELSPDEASGILSVLQSEGRLVYRRFGDEFRLWEGSDFDIEAELDGRRNNARTAELETALNQAAPMRPVVAQRHAHMTGTLRVFEQRYVSSRDLSSSRLEAAPWADGLVAYVLAATSDAAVAGPATLEDGRPLVIAVSRRRAEVEEAAVEATAVSLLLSECRSAHSDTAVLSELRQRAMATQDALSQRLREAFALSSPELQWFAGTDSVAICDMRSLSSYLSLLCDESYPDGLVLQNEMLNRERLTSQGAKARRELIAAMITSSKCPALGISGFGPERSMYESVLRATGMHVESDDGSWGMVEPTSQSGTRKVWDAIVSFLTESEEQPRYLDELFEILGRPPFGVRTGPIPVLVVAALMTMAEDVALYQDGTFEPMLAPETLERLVKAPERFSVRFLNVTGARSRVLVALAEGFGAARLANHQVRNVGLITAVGPLWSLARKLPDYSLRTRTISERAIRMRTVLQSAREPESLVFEDLPAALELLPFTARRQFSDADVKEYVGRLVECSSELRRAYPRLLDRIEHQLAECLCPGEAPANIRADISVRAGHLAGRVLNQRLKAFAGFAVNANLKTAEWLEAIAMTVTDKSPRDWRDEDADIFDLRLKDLAGQFLRTELLWHQRAAYKLERKGFEAFRLSVTNQDGDEIDDVVWVDESRSALVSSVVEATLTAVDERLGEADRKLFLAALARELLRNHVVSQVPATLKSVQTDDGERRVG